MIAFLRGIMAGKNHTSAFVDVNGVGYELTMSQAALSALPDTGEEITVHTYMNVTESGIALYGFLNQDEEQMFRLLTGVSGIGPKIALAALSTFEPANLCEAIVMQDTTRVATIPGVGKKSAQRIILELKDKMQGADGVTFAGERGASIGSSVLGDVRAALLSMGFTSAECEAALSDADPDATESELLQSALKRLGGV